MEDGWLRRAVLFACALAAASLAIGLFVTWRLARHTPLDGDDLAWLPPLAALGAGSYLCRFLRWHVLTRQVAPRLPVPTSLRIYSAGFAMGLTPGRVGEFCKFTLLRDATGVPEARSAVIFPIERVTEAASFAALAVGGALLRHIAVGPIGLGALAAVAAVPALAALGAWLRLGRPRRPAARGSVRSWLGAAIDGARQVAGPGPLALALLCAFAARTCDVLLFWTAGAAVGLPVSLPGAALAWGLAGMTGGLLLLPGGVGAVEGSLVATVAALGGDPSTALLAALLARCMTLWLWVPPGLWFAARGALAPSRDLRRPVALR